MSAARTPAPTRACHLNHSAMSAADASTPGIYISVSAAPHIGRPLGLVLSADARRRIGAAAALRNAEHESVQCDSDTLDMVIRILGGQERLAWKLDLGRTAVCRWHLDGRVPSYRIPQLAALLGCTPIALRHLLVHGWAGVNAAQARSAPPPAPPARQCQPTQGS